jgi:hypothetical protein
LYSGLCRSSGAVLNGIVHNTWSKVGMHNCEIFGVAQVQMAGIEDITFLIVPHA